MSTAAGVACDGFAYWVATIRKVFEERGLLLAYDAAGRMIEFGDPVRAARFVEHRRRLNGNALNFAAFLAAEGLRLAADQLTYFSHWITPHGAPRRYDTRFFIARAPDAQDVLHDNVETIAHRWVRPPEALAAHERGEFKMRTPTLHTLELFAPFTSADALIAAMRKLRDVPALLPHIAKDGRRLLPGDPGYEEAASAAGRGEWKT